MRPFFALAVALLVPSHRAVPRGAFPELPVFEGRAIALRAEQAAALARGEPAVQVLETKDGRVAAVFGIVEIHETRKAFVDRLTNFTQSLHAPGIQRFGVFVTPTSAADVGTFSISASAAASLRKCRTGGCGFKISASDMAYARTMLDSGAEGSAKLAAYAQRRVAEYVSGYGERGNRALMVYDDYGKGGIRASDAFSALLAASPVLTEIAPALQQYLEQFPRARPEGASEAIYWSLENLKGLLPTLSISHVVAFAPPDRPNITVVVTKQLYADHYFEGMLDERIILDRPDSANGDGIYLMVLRQYKFDNLPGGILNIRGRARAALRDRMEEELRRMSR